MENSGKELSLEPNDLARIEEGIAAADRGEFATDDEVEAEFARWKRVSDAPPAP